MKELHISSTRAYNGKPYILYPSEINGYSNYSNDYSNPHKQMRELTNIGKQCTVILSLTRTKKDGSKQALPHPVFETYEVIHKLERLYTWLST